MFFFADLAQCAPNPVSFPEGGGFREIGKGAFDRLSRDHGRVRTEIMRLTFYLEKGRFWSWKS